MQQLRIFDLACQRIEMQMAIGPVEEVDIETIAILGQAAVGRRCEVGLGAADDAALVQCHRLLISGKGCNRTVVERAAGGALPDFEAMTPMS